MSNQTTVNRLLQGTEFNDPRMYDLLSLLITDVYNLQNQINPPAGTSFGFTGQIFAADDVTGFTITVYPDNVRLSWVGVAGITQYIIKYLAGSHTAADYGIASVILTTSTLSADINPLTIPLTTGYHTFFIKAINNAGVDSDTAQIQILNIPAILAPTVSPTVISNSVLLNWTIPASLFAIAYYNVYKNGVLLGTMNGTFEAIFETAGGTYTYAVQAVDIVGNLGTASAGAIVTVANPPDYILTGTVNSTLTGTKTNCAKEMIGTTNYLIACIDIAETYANHFITNAWATPDAQIAAGYNLYIEPAKTTGKYVEVFDFGALFSNVIATGAWSTIPIVGSVSTSTTTIETSVDNVTWSTPVTGVTIFGASVRYVRLTVNFVGSNNKSLMYLYGLSCFLNVKREQDGGSASVFAADVGGTVVSFNKTFKSVDTITVTPVSTVRQTAVYDFAFPVNPTTFKVLLFDAAGARVNGTITWDARGIV